MGQLELAELMSAAADGELTAAERQRVDAALAESPAWKRELESLRALKAGVRSVCPVVDPPASLSVGVGAVLDRIDRDVPRERPTEPVGLRLGLRHWLPALGLAALLAFGGLQFAPRLLGGGGVQTAAIEFDPTRLADNHRYWHDRFATHGEPDVAPAQMAQALATKVGYEVVPPDTSALGADLVGCTVCGQSFPNQPVAMFLMRHRASGSELSLFELQPHAGAVDTAAFQPVPGHDAACGGERIAEAEGTRMVLWSQGDRYAVLVASNLDYDTLVDLAPQALQVAAAMRLAAAR